MKDRIDFVVLVGCIGGQLRLRVVEGRCLLDEVRPKCPEMESQ